MLNKALNKFAPISLEQMKSVRLMNRVDTKFVTTVPRLLRLLELASDEYYVQEVDGVRNSAYTTLYYDTPSREMYITHHNGCLGRQKVRVRRYIESDLTFLEVKRKNNHGRTRKKRIVVDTFGIDAPERLQFLREHNDYDVAGLTPALQNWFKRITLVNKAKTERVTIDTELRFHNLRSGREHNLENAVIVELKRDGNVPSPLLAMLTQLRIHPHGFSKYCMGSALSDPSLKQNNFKRRLRYVAKLIAADCPHPTDY